MASAGIVQRAGGRGRGDPDGARRQGILVLDLAVDEHGAHGRQEFERVAVEADEVGVLPRLDAPDPVAEVDGFRRPDGDGLEGVLFGHPVADAQGGELAQVLLFGPGVGLEGDLDAGRGQDRRDVGEDQGVLGVGVEHGRPDVDVDVLPLGELVDEEVGLVGVAQAEPEPELVGQADGAHDMRGRIDVDMDGDLALQDADEGLLAEVSPGREDVLAGLFIALVGFPALLIFLGFDERLAGDGVDGHDRGGHLLQIGVITRGVALDRPS